MKNEYYQSVFQLVYFGLVLVVKLLNADQQYFQVIFSIVFSALFVPMDLALQNYIEISQYTCSFIYQCLNIFCLGTIDIGIQDEYLLKSIQYFFLGYLFGKQYMATNIYGNMFKSVQKIARVTYIIILIAAINFSNIYIHQNNTSLIGLIGSEILFGAILLYQIREEIKWNPILQIQNQFLFGAYSGSQKSKKKFSRSYTENQELHEPDDQINKEQSSQKIHGADDNTIQINNLEAGAKKNSSRDQNNFLREDSSVHSNMPSQRGRDAQWNFYKTLFNQFPEGILILDENSKIEYNNIQIPKLLQCSKEDILSKLNSLKNYLYKVQEEAQCQQLFAALHQKLRQNSHDSIQEQYFMQDQKMKDDDSESEFQMQNQYDIELSKAETLEQELLKALGIGVDKSSFHIARYNSIRSTSGIERMKFINEVKMICSLREQDENIDSNLETQKVEGWLLQITIKPYQYEGKHWVLIMLKDVSLFNQFNVLQQINSNKSQMLNQVAHELRTPLNCIVLISQQLIDKYKESDKVFTEKFMFPILSSANQILRLVNDLLDLAQLKAGKFKLSFQDFNLQKLLFELSTTMAFTVNSKKLELSLIFDKNIPETIKSDQHRIRQIILNLISNSIKFTNVGGIKVSATQEDQKMIKICVEDTGLGIKGEDLERLFKPFGKLEDTKNMNTTGVGLGLMISNIMAHKLSNTEKGLEVTSEGINKGTKFTFYVYDHTERTIVRPTSIVEKKLMRKESNMSIVYVQKNEPISASKFKPKIVKVDTELLLQEDAPLVFQFKCQDTEVDSSENQSEYHNRLFKLQQSNQSHTIKHLNYVEEEQSKDGHSSGLEKCKCPQILLVDDESTNLMALTLQFPKKYRIQQALSGQKCLEILKNWKCEQSLCNWIKIIITDLSMPGMDGMQTTKAIRLLEQQNKQKCYIVGCSGYTDEQTKQQALNSGMDNYITKPVDTHNLIENILKKQLGY